MALQVRGCAYTTYYIPHILLLYYFLLPTCRAILLPLLPTCYLQGHTTTILLPTCYLQGHGVARIAETDELRRVVELRHLVSIVSIVSQVS